MEAGETIRFITKQGIMEGKILGFDPYTDDPIVELETNNGWITVPEENMIKRK